MNCGPRCARVRPVDAGFLGPRKELRPPSRGRDVGGLIVLIAHRDAASRPPLQRPTTKIAAPWVLLWGKRVSSGRLIFYVMVILLSRKYWLSFHSFLSLLTTAESGTFTKQ